MPPISTTLDLGELGLKPGGGIRFDAAVPVGEFVFGAQRYELAEDLTGHHHHVICTKCGMIRDFTLDRRLERSLDAAFNEAARDAGLRPGHHDIDIYGTCTDCEVAAD